MSNLFSAMNSETTRTWNGMRTNQTSENPCVDLFYTIGSARGKFDTIKANLAGALSDDVDVAVRIILWSRDVREGAGERQIFRDTIDFMATNSMVTYDQALRIMKKVPELGRWDDLKAFIGTALETEALDLWAKAIFNGNGLAAKWAPRKGEVANKLRKAMDLSPKRYRKTLVANTAVVEQAMCAGNWDEINFSHVPSLAASRYQKAFGRNATEAYEAYKAELVKDPKERDPSVKINAKAVYPYDIVKSVYRGDSVVADEQWKALPDYMESSENSGILPMVDTSGSMGCQAGGYGSKSNVSCLDVAISIGLYVSERNRGVFKDEFLTFSAAPELQKTKGNLSSRVNQMRRASWGMNTNVIAAFDLILKSAVSSNLPQEDMPKTLLILSDMQFDYCAKFDDTAMEAVARRFRDAGYERPNIVFWNINSAGNGVPSTADKFGTALVSGFSPSIMASILKADDFTPKAIMLKTVMNERYDW